MIATACCELGPRCPRVPTPIAKGYGRSSTTSTGSRPPSSASRRRQFTRGHRGGEEPAVHRVPASAAGDRVTATLYRDVIEPASGFISSSAARCSWRLRHHPSRRRKRRACALRDARAGRRAAGRRLEDGGDPSRARLLMDAEPSLREFVREVSRPDAEINLGGPRCAIARSEYPISTSAPSSARLGALAHGWDRRGGRPTPLARCTGFVSTCSRSRVSGGSVPRHSRPSISGPESPAPRPRDVALRRADGDADRAPQSGAVAGEARIPRTPAPRTGTHEPVQAREGIGRPPRRSHPCARAPRRPSWAPTVRSGYSLRQSPARPAPS